MTDKWQPETADVRTYFSTQGVKTPQDQERRADLFDLWLEAHEWTEVVNYLTRLHGEAEAGSDIETFLEAELRNLGAW